MMVCEMNAHSSSIVTMFELFKIFIAHEEVEQGAKHCLDAR